MKYLRLVGRPVFSALRHSRDGLSTRHFLPTMKMSTLAFACKTRAGRIGYEPRAVVYHKIGMTSGRMKGFTTYQTLKNLPLLVWKNMSLLILLRVLPRFYLAYWMFFGRAILRRHGWSAVKGVVMSTFWLFLETAEIVVLDMKRKVSNKYIWSIISHEICSPMLRALRHLRKKWWGLTRRHV